MSDIWKALEDLRNEIQGKPQKKSKRLWEIEKMYADILDISMSELVFIAVKLGGSLKIELDI